MASPYVRNDERPGFGFQFRGKIFSIIGVTVATLRLGFVYEHVKCDG